MVSITKITFNNRVLWHSQKNQRIQKGRSMKLTHKILIVTSLSVPLHAMEDKTLSASNNATRNNDNFYKKNDLYKKAYTTLDLYNPNNIQSAENIINIITKTKELKSCNIEPKHIGKFAYHQPIKTKFFSPEIPPYNSPLHISVLFERIAQYNAHLEKNNFTSPTLEQFSQYTNNQKITAIIEKAATFRVLLDLEKINAEKKIITNIPFTIAMKEFDNLLKDIAMIRETSPSEIKTLADILYLDINKEQPEKSEKL